MSNNASPFRPAYLKGIEILKEFPQTYYKIYRPAYLKGIEIDDGKFSFSDCEVRPAYLKGIEIHDHWSGGEIFGRPSSLPKRN